MSRLKQRIPLFIKKLGIALLAVVLAFPHYTHGQQASQVSDSASLAALLGLNSSSSLDSRVLLSPADQALWDQALEDGTIDKMDKRITAFLLPELANRYNLVAAQTLLGYTDKDRQTSRELDGSSSKSQRTIGKAAALTAIGYTTCSSEVLFGRYMDPIKPLWIHYQVSNDPANTLKRFFGRSFDLATRQSFWNEARAFTNTLIAPRSWSEFIQTIAKGAIEEQFGLPAGSLQTVSVGELNRALGRLRIAAQLDWPDIPNADSKEELFAILGQWEIEDSLALPRYSLGGDTWRAIYQSIGFRVLEDQLSPTDQPEPSPFSEDSLLNEEPRFQQLAKVLEKRATIYIDGRRALNLPTEEYLPTPEGQSNILERLILGDPDAFATVGAYFLADSLNLPPTEIESLIQAVNQGEDRLPSLANARPISAEYQPDHLFSSEGTVESRTELFMQAGKKYETLLATNRKRLNESVLLAISGNNKTPSESAVISLLTNESKRNTAYQEIGRWSAQEAGYAAGFTAQSLIQEGLQLLANATDTTYTDLDQLDDADRNDSDPAIKQVGSQLDNIFGWPEGTTLSIAHQEFAEESTAATLTQEKQITLGALSLWSKLDVPEELQSFINDLYIRGTIGEVPAVEDEEQEEIIEDETDSGEEFVEEEDTDPTDDEFIQLAIPAAEQPLAEALQSTLLVPMPTIDALLSGRMQPALSELTLGSLAHELGNSSTVTPAKLISLYSQPTKELAEVVASQAEAVQDHPFASSAFFESLQQAASTEEMPAIWEALTQEIIRQWNIGCTDKQEETREAVASLIDFLVNLPENEPGVAKEASRPVQIFTHDVERLSDTTKQTIEDSYPGIGKRGVKWGVYDGGDEVNRLWDHVYVGY